jgi:hypothetical protein
MKPWTGQLSRIEAIKVLDRATDHDDPYWDGVVEDHYDELSDTMPSIMDVFAALGVTKAEYEKATGADNVDWPEVPAGEETGWVIEREDSEPSRPMYYAGFDWSYDNLKAMRFARRQDAELMSRYMFPGEPHRIADHMWCP